MDSTEFDLIESVQDRHWWWLGRRRIIERLIQKFLENRASPLRIADVGSGLGANIPMLRQFGQVTALEPSADAVEKIKRAWADDNCVRVLRWTSPEPVNDKFDLILLADVLEHIDDDDAAIDWIWRHLAPGGHVILTVPAHQYLWTEMDEVVHHYRRYNRHGMVRLLNGRLAIRRLSFYNLLLYPVKVAFVGFAHLRRILRPASRRRSFNDVPPAPINALFKWILCCEAALIENFPLPFGVSIVVVACRESSAPAS